MVGPLFIDPLPRLSLLLYMRLPIQAAIFVVRTDDKGGIEYLMLHRVLPRISFWQPVTGGVESGETVGQTAARELTEDFTCQASYGPQHRICNRDT